MRNRVAFSGIFLAAGMLTSLSGAGAPLPGPMPPAENGKVAHDLFREIIEIKSTHEIGTAGVARVIAQRLVSGGLPAQDVKIVPESGYPNQVNVVVRLRGKGKAKP